MFAVSLKNNADLSLPALSFPTSSSPNVVHVEPNIVLDLALPYYILRGRTLQPELWSLLLDALESVNGAFRDLNHDTLVHNVLLDF